MNTTQIENNKQENQQLERSSGESSQIYKTAEKSFGVWGGSSDGEHMFHLCHIADHVKAGDRILELNCGDGDFLLKLAKKYSKVSLVGVTDSIAKSLRATARAKELGLQNVIFITDTMDIADEIFDVVVSRQGLEKTEYEVRVALIETITHTDASGAFYFSRFMPALGKYAVATTQTPRARFMERKRIYHIPLQRIQLRSFAQFLKLKFFRKKNLKHEALQGAITL